jgi:hypothetical protein
MGRSFQKFRKVDPDQSKLKRFDEDQDLDLHFQIEVYTWFLDRTYVLQYFLNIKSFRSQEEGYIEHVKTSTRGCIQNN